MNRCTECGKPFDAEEMPGAHALCVAITRERGARCVLDVVEKPGPTPIGAANSVMRRAWELGRELERGRRAIAREIEESAKRMTAT